MNTNTTDKECPFQSWHTSRMSGGNEHIQNLVQNKTELSSHGQFLHIAGTNGKGSTSQYLFNILCHAGYHCLKFTSPHLLSVQERFESNSGIISHEELIALRNQIIKITDTKNMTMFEILTLCFFLWSQKMKPDFLVVETGLGGRLDTTNITKDKTLAILTSIGLDHCSILGSTTKEIALEKLPVARSSRPLFIPDQIREKNTIQEWCKKENVPLHSVCEMELETGIDGLYQKTNASLALAAASFLGVDSDLSKQVIQITKLKGRMEKVKNHCILDVSHNPDGIEACLKSIPENLNTVVFSCMRDKDSKNMLTLLEKRFSNRIFIELPQERALKFTDFSLWNKQTPECLQGEMKNDKLTHALICGTFLLAPLVLE